MEPLCRCLKGTEGGGGEGAKVGRCFYKRRPGPRPRRGDARVEERSDLGLTDTARVHPHKNGSQNIPSRTT